MKQATITLIYLGLIDKNYDKAIECVVPNIIKDETGADAEWYFSECTVNEPFEREIGWNLSRLLTQDEVDLLKEEIYCEFPETQLNYFEHAS